MKRSLAIGGIVLAAAMTVAAQQPPGPGRGDGPPAGGGGAFFGAGFNAQQTFEQRCATCHTAEGITVGDRKALSMAALRELPTDRVYQTISTGLMAVQATGIVDRDKRTLAAFVTGKPFGSAESLGVSAMKNACSSNPPLGDLNASPSWLG